jgi:hypothetical protein
MKRAIILLLITFSFNLYAQKWSNELLCTSDTLVVEPQPKMRNVTKNQDQRELQPYRIVQCRTRSNFGLRFDVAVSNYYYGEQTTSWLGQHAGPNFNFVLTIEKFNVGFRFKPWTIEPQKELEFNGVILPTTARLNPIKIDYYVGFSFDFERLISLEPYLGYNRSSFVVINEDVLNQNFSFEKTGGLVLGTTVNKYFRLKDYEYLSLFGSIGYGFVNFEKVQSSLDNGYFEWNLGIAFKGFFTSNFYRKV